MAAGFEEASVRGSHVKLVHADGRRTVVPVHGGRDIPRGTLASILRQAELTTAEFVALT